MTTEIFYHVITFGKCMDKRKGHAVNSGKKNVAAFIEVKTLHNVHILDL